ncbi:uroporphyrinogen-III C-methyltransferase [Rheinheimera sp.]|uniref:uroporphyrinogen-III C-methyltransferase n=1 Tax=Rheinheimera sp. TaxID=1869214 RepID=UPI002734BD04|nr:uroporphyrinogen-III C-methyltransferase [Rheinheimera sp.]MDP2714122.1 uroporphyrinogen-III C-methyltransferase [Rheinheimera sp.]
MSDSLERATEMDAPLQQLKQKIDAEPAPRKGGSFSGGLSLLLVLALGCAIGAGGYWLWPQWQSLQQQTDTLQQNQQRLTEQSTQQLDSSKQLQQQLLAEQQQRLTQLEQNLQQQQQQLAAQNQAQIQALRQLVQERDSAPPRHWLLAEIEYLLQLAAQKVWLEQDFSTARALLASADEKLLKLDDPSLLPVRQALATDLEQLSRLHQPDLTAVHIQLQQMRKHSMLLPLKQQEQPEQLEPAPGTELSNWRDTLSYYWQQSWSKLVRVRSAVPEDYFSLTTEQQLMLRVSLNQQLLLAELAAMQHQPQVYAAALQQAADQLQRYFNSDDAGVLQLSSDLAALAAVEVAVATPTPLTALPQLQQYQQQLTESSL